jgi:hypothetical protein
MSADSGRHAREVARALLTARLHDDPAAFAALLGELRSAELRCSCAELVELALWMLRLAAAAIPAQPEALLAAMLTNRAALEPTTRARHEAEGR